MNTSIYKHQFRSSLLCQNIDTRTTIDEIGNHLSSDAGRIRADTRISHSVTGCSNDNGWSLDGWALRRLDTGQSDTEGFQSPKGTCGFCQNRLPIGGCGS